MNIRKILVYVAYVIVILITIDFIMSQLFWQKLATHPEYFAQGFRCQNPDFHHGLKKNVSAIDSWGGLYEIRTNSLGFKDSAQRRISKAPSKYRIVFIGDSFTEGMGFPYAKTFVGLIGQALEPAGIEVLNAGVGSYSPKLYYLKMKYLLEKEQIKIDHLVIFIDLSDIQDEIVYKSWNPGDSTDGPLLSAMKYYLIRNSVIGNIGDRIFNNKRAPAYEDTGEFASERGKWYRDPIYTKWGKEGSLLAKQYMHKLVQLCVSHKIGISLVVYPWPEQLWEGIPENGHVLFWKRFAEEERINFLNVTPFFLSSDPGATADKYYLSGDIHFNEAGHALISAVFLAWYNYVQNEPYQVHSTP